ncbi:MAG: hypothetical protein ACYCTB_10340 [bacterium]
MGERIKFLKVIPAKAGKFRSRNACRFCSRGCKPRAKRSSRTINLYRQFWVVYLYNLY